MLTRHRTPRTLILAVILAAACACAVTPACTAAVGSSGALDAAAWRAPVADQVLYERSRCSAGASYPGCCRPNATLPCSTELVADPDCCENPFAASRTGAVVVFPVPSGQPFAQATLVAEADCSPGDGALCSPSAPVAVFACGASSCGASDVRASCGEGPFLAQATPCTGTGACRVARNVTAVLELAIARGWTSVMLRLEAAAPTHGRLWPTTLACARANASCSPLVSAPFTALRLAPRPPVLVLNATCASSSQCRPASSLECIEEGGAWSCGECADRPGSRCRDREGREGRCCEGACAALGIAWTDTDANGLADAGADRCGSGACEATLVCSSGAWGCASRGRACCSLGARRECDGSGSCAGGSVVECSPDTCALGSCLRPCSTDLSCDASERCVVLGGTRVCRPACSSASDCTLMPCVDTNANGGVDACDPCSTEGARCSGAGGAGWCCGGSCVPTVLPDADGDNLLTAGDACGAAPCSGRAACAAAAGVGGAPSWRCSSEGLGCCAASGRGTCSSGSCSSIAACSPNVCESGRCRPDCLTPSDCSGQTSCIEAGGAGAPWSCLACSANEGRACLAADGTRGRCCGGVCAATATQGTTCVLDCRCAPDLLCHQGTGTCLRDLATACGAEADCASRCCAEGSCRRRAAVGRDGACASDCECGDGLVCGGGRCRPGLGAACPGDFACASQCCVYGACVARGYTQGGGPCLGDCQCVAGYSCIRLDPSDALGVCLVSPGRSCLADGACASGCCARGACVTARDVVLRGPCASDCQCGPTARCINATCLVPLGGACAAGRECELGVCVDGTCRERGSAGLFEACALPNECRSGLECVGSTCLLSLGRASAQGARCASGCSNGTDCIRPASTPFQARCTEPCACAPGLVCNRARGSCLRDLGGSCTSGEMCDRGCCANGVCAHAGSLANGAPCANDCQCAGGVCDRGACSAARPCRSTGDCLVEPERRVCAGAVCKARCEPEGAACDSANATGWCCTGTCMPMPAALLPIGPLGACGKGGCAGNVSCRADGWACSTKDALCCESATAGACSRDGSCTGTESCADRCDGSVAVVRECREGRCREGRREDCAASLGFCRDGRCAGCSSSAECAAFNTCNGTLHRGYACDGGRCVARERQCAAEALLCAQAGCSGCMSTAECAAQYGANRTCDLARHICRSLVCMTDEDCPDACEANVLVERVCVDARCKEGDRVPCVGGEVCSPQGCGGCASDVECVVHYGLDHTCRDARCHRTCGDGSCEASRGEDCAWCPDCVCNAPVLCDPASPLAQADGCVPDSDADRVPDDADTNPAAPGAPCDSPGDCPPHCRRGYAVTRACTGGRCAASSVEPCTGIGAVCVSGSCVPCSGPEACRRAYGPLHACSKGACRRDADSDGVMDDDDACPLDPGRSQGCAPEGSCGAREDCRTSAACPCGDGLLCAPHRPGADAAGCAEPSCGDGWCDRPLEREATCCTDCGCLGGGLCDNRTAVCAKGCGDGSCSPGECAFCRDDCTPSTCLDGRCQSAIGETAENSRDCSGAVELAALAHHDVSGTDSVEVPVQVSNTGSVATSFTVRVRATNARAGLREVQTPVIDPGESHGFMLALELTSGSEPATIELSAVSDADPQVAANRTIVVERSTLSLLSRLLGGSFLSGLAGSRALAAIVVGLGLTLFVVLLGGVVLVRAGTRARRPRTLEESGMAAGYDSYYAASYQAGWAGAQGPEGQAGQGASQGPPGAGWTGQPGWDGQGQQGGAGQGGAGQGAPGWTGQGQQGQGGAG